MASFNRSCCTTIDSIDTGSLKFYAYPSQSGAQTKQNDPKTHTVLRIAEKCLIPIDDTLVQKLGIMDGDAVSQMASEDGTVRLVFTKRTPEQ